MRRGLDVEKAEAALKRAAYKALHGTREERSGRFIGQDETANGFGKKFDIQIAETQGRPKNDFSRSA